MRHDAAYRENGVVSDLEPLTIPNLLQKVLHDPYVAWNVRSIEIWVARDSWDSWGSVAVEVPESVANTVQPSIGQTAYRYEWEDVFENKIENPQELPDEQLEVYIGLLHKYAHFEQNDLDEAREEFSIGADYFYKILFILICPRLNCLKHANVYDTLIAAEWMSNELFWWLSRIISRSRDKQSWAPGLESLKNVALGVETGLWFQTDKHKRLYPSSVFRSVMMLPKLKSVYFGKFNMYSDIDELPEYPTPQYRGMIGSSSVEYIFLDQLDHNLGKEEEEEIFSFLLVPKSLKSLTVRGNVNELNKLAKYITMLQLGRSLESLIEYSDDGVWGLYRPINMTQTLKRLSRTTIDVWAFLTEIFECDGYVITDYGMRKTWEDLERRQKCLSRLKDAFPKNSEVLLFQGGQSKRGGGQTIDAATLEEILIQLVQCKEQYPALKDYGDMNPKSQSILRNISYTNIILKGRQNVQAVLTAKPSASKPLSESYFDSIGDAETLQRARSEVSAISNAIARFEPVTMFTRPGNVEQAMETISKNVTVQALDASQLWIRDTGPIFVHEVQNGRSAGLKLGFNYWGGKFASFGDETVAAGVLAAVAAESASLEGEETSSGQSDSNRRRQMPSTGFKQRLAVPGAEPGFISEGGAIEVDGQGTLLATESSIINPNRNPGMSKKELEEKFQEYLGISKTIWLPGVKGYDVTDYHIDAFARFIKPGQVLLSRPAKHAEPCVIQAYIEAKEVLNKEKDARGNSLEVHEVEEPHPNDLVGELWGVAVASYANYYLANGGLIMPCFGVPRLDDEAYGLFKQYFPDRDIVRVPLNALPKLGGGIHCATQQVPADS
ncbi:hypothetical protein ACHAPQ_004583 [Fusarium lateritium]